MGGHFIGRINAELISVLEASGVSSRGRWVVFFGLVRWQHIRPYMPLSEV